MNFSFGGRKLVFIIEIQNSFSLLWFVNWGLNDFYLLLDCSWRNLGCFFDFSLFFLSCG